MYECVCVCVTFREDLSQGWSQEEIASLNHRHFTSPNTEALLLYVTVSAVVQTHPTGTPATAAPCAETACKAGEVGQLLTFSHSNF